MELQTMRCEIKGPVAHVTLNRPDVLNAMNVQWAHDFLAIAESLEGNSQVKVAIIRGGGRAFSSGIDLKTLSRREFPMEWFRVYERGLRAIETMDKVVISAIHGYCIGGGLQVALASDIRIVAEGTKFGLTAVKECLVPGLGTYRLARFIGPGRAKRIILSGEFFDTQEANAMGLIDYLVPQADFDRRVAEITQVYLNAASEGQRQAKRLVNMAFDLGWEEFLEKYIEAQTAALASEQHQEAMTAFREGREPRF
jgi:enoyl-CoA hydratase/carnithine racemase